MRLVESCRRPILRDPFGEAAVEDRDRVVTEPPQQPRRLAYMPVSWSYATIWRPSLIPSRPSVFESDAAFGSG
jgi:hypothetical protein